MSSRSTPGEASTRAAATRREAADGATITPVGVDVGSARQVFVATTISDGVEGAVAVDVAYVQTLYSEFQSATHRLGAAPAYDPDNLGELVARYWPRFRAAFANAADDVLEYARRHPAPVLVVEDLPQSACPLVDVAFGGMRIACWCPPVAQAVLVERAVDAGVPVATVDPEMTSQECHVCSATGELEDGALRCETSDCPVDEVCRDRSAAVSIAKRSPDSLR